MGVNIMKNLLKAGALISTAGLMMGNQSCEQQPAQGRELKRIVEVGHLKSPKIVLPQGGSFDFEYVANQQIYVVLQNSEHFAIRYAPPVAQSTTPEFSDQKYFNVSNNDQMMLKALAANSGISDKPQFSKEAECMVNLPNARIEGSVNAFEMIGGGGLQVGFNPAGPIDVSGVTGVGFNIEFAQLALSILAKNPLTSGVLGAANVTSKQTKTKVNFTLNFGAFQVGPSAYYQTPLAKVTEKALISGVNSLYQDLNNSADGEWYTRIMMDHDSDLVMVGGKNIGVQEGDEFNVYNEMYYWDGDPCNSQYRGGAGGTPVATMKVHTVGDEISFARRTDQGDENPVIGAKVRILKLVPGTPAKAAK